jgi:trimeric autotransporter adhesin
MLLSLCASASVTYRIDTVAGSDYVGDGGSAREAMLGVVEGIVFAPDGSLYISDANDHRIRKIDPAGLISTVAGNGHAGFRGDGGKAAQAQLNNPYGLALDRSGNLYVADFTNARVRRISPDGRIATVAGGGTVAFKDGLRAIDLRLAAPRNVAVDDSGNVYVSDFGAHRVFRITPQGLAYAIAGTGTSGYSGDGGPANKAQLWYPAGLALDAAGALYIADSRNKRIRKVAGGTINTVLGEGVPRLGNFRFFTLSSPAGIALDRTGNLYAADSTRVAKLAPDGTAVLLPVAARDISLDAGGALYAAAGEFIRTLDPDGQVRIVAGCGRYTNYGDGSPATLARLYRPFGIVLDAGGNLYVADQANNRVRRIDPSGTIRAFAGTGSAGFSGEEGPATAAQLNSPSGLAAAPDGSLFVSDTRNHRVRLIDTSGRIRTVAGGGEPAFAGDGLIAIEAQLSSPEGLALDVTGTLYIADRDNHRIRALSPDGVIRTVAGSGAKGGDGDGGPALLSELNTPRGVAVDAAGNLYIADSGNHRVRRVTPDGFIETIAGNGLRGFDGDGGSAQAALLDSPIAVAFEPGTGDLLIADAGNHRIRRVTQDGLIQTIAGYAPGFQGDGGPASRAALNMPVAFATAEDGTVLVSDFLNDRIRKLSPYTTAPLPVTQFQVVNSASLLPGPVAPGELVSVLGTGLGPEDGQSGRLEPTGRMGEEIAGVRVLFDGRPAPLFYAGSEKLNVQVPYRLSGTKQTTLQVFRDGDLVGETALEVTPVAPGIFTVSNGTGQAAALNQDGTINCETNPAPRGSTVTFYLTGEGQTSPSGVDGAPAREPFPKPLAGLAVKIGYYSADVEFAGAAPGFAGLLQVNARVPAGFAPSGVLPVEITIGDVRTQSGVTIAVR